MATWRALPISNTVCCPCASSSVSYLCFAVPGAPLYDEGASHLGCDCYGSNMELLGSLREDKNSAELQRIISEEAVLGWMSPAVRADRVDLNQVLLVPRFGVEQGITEEGEVKVRPVDHMSWSWTGGERKGRKRTRKEVKASTLCPSVAVTSPPAGRPIA